MMRHSLLGLLLVLSVSACGLLATPPIEVQKRDSLLGLGKILLVENRGDQDLEPALAEATNPEEGLIRRSAAGGEAGTGAAALHDCHRGCQERGGQFRWFGGSEELSRDGRGLSAPKIEAVGAEEEAGEHLHRHGVRAGAVPNDFHVTVLGRFRDQDQQLGRGLLQDRGGLVTHRDVDWSS